jgi:hypothetical protein
MNGKLAVGETELELIVKQFDRINGAAGCDQRAKVSFVLVGNMRDVRQHLSATVAESAGTWPVVADAAKVRGCLRGQGGHPTLIYGAL